MFHKTRMRLTILNTLIFFLILSLFGAGLYFYVKIQLYAKIDASLLEQAKNVQLRQYGMGETLSYQMSDVIDPRTFFITRDVAGTITSQSTDTGVAITKLDSTAMVSTLPQSVDKPPKTVVIEGHSYRVLAVSTKNNLTFVNRNFSVSTLDEGLWSVGSAKAEQAYFGGFPWTDAFNSPMVAMSSLVRTGVATSPPMAVMGVPLVSSYSKLSSAGNTQFAATRMTPAISAIGSAATAVTLTIASPVATMQFISNMDPELNMLHSLSIIIVVGVAIGGLLTLLAGFYLAQRALVPIRESWERQQQFVADASHELRTPLAVIQANTELLLRHPDHSIEQESGYISTILKESKRINKLITSLLTFARSDSNQIEIQTKSVSIDSLINDCVQRFTPLASIKEIQLKVKLECTVDMIADEERIHQLLVILMDNALKYTNEQGEIHISSSKSTHSVNLIIEDTGVGIPESDLPFIFERFFRSDKIRARTDGSMGLGLSIAQWIVERHGGKISAESQLGKGTRMALSFPLRK